MVFFWSALFPVPAIPKPPRFPEFLAFFLDPQPWVKLPRCLLNFFRLLTTMFFSPSLSSVFRFIVKCTNVPSLMRSAIISGFFMGIDILLMDHALDKVIDCLAPVAKDSPCTIPGLYSFPFKSALGVIEPENRFELFSIYLDPFP